MRWKWREATSKWLRGSCYETTILEYERASCIYHQAYSMWACIDCDSQLLDPDQSLYVVSKCHDFLTSFICYPSTTSTVSPVITSTFSCSLHLLLSLCFPMWSQSDFFRRKRTPALPPACDSDRPLILARCRRQGGADKEIEI